MFIEGNYLHSRKYIYLRHINSFKIKAICSFEEKLYSFNNVSFADIAEISIQKLSPATL